MTLLAQLSSIFEQLNLAGIRELPPVQLYCNFSYQKQVQRQKHKVQSKAFYANEQRDALRIVKLLYVAVSAGVG